MGVVQVIMVLKSLRVIGTAGGCQCVARLRAPEDSPVTMRDFSSFENSGAMRWSPEAPATMKWSRLVSRSQVMFMLLRVGSKR